jgi:hypothetical protein
MSETKETGYKRINFFKGFLTTEKDWNDAEKYHIDKRMLHNRLFHSPGVAMGYGGDLRVTSRARGDLSVEVQPGYAIDGVGHDLMLFDATIKNINPEEFRLPQTIYIVLRFYEEMSDFIAYKENLEYKGHRRVLESCKIEVSPDRARHRPRGRAGPHLPREGRQPRPRRPRPGRSAQQRDRHALRAQGRPRRLVHAAGAAAPAAEPAVADPQGRARVQPPRHHLGEQRHPVLQHGAHARRVEHGRPAEHLRHLLPAHRERG